VRVAYQDECIARVLHKILQRNPRRHALQLKAVGDGRKKPISLRDVKFLLDGLLIW
jgi:hypothetical protein